MIFLNRLKFAVLTAIALVIVLASCEQDPTTLGSGVVGGDPFITNNAVFDVFARNKGITSVRTNKLSLYQLGVFNDPVYGNTEAQVTSQVLLSVVDPTFGDTAADSEEIPENETIDSVYLYIPFQLNPSGDADADGLADVFDIEPDNANSDSDGDGLTDSQENTNGTDPLNVDTDGDGINDNLDDDFVPAQFARNFDLDSIYGDRTMPFTLTLQRSNFFLRDLDPQTNFLEAQEYFSDQDFSAFLTEQIASVTTTFNENEILVSSVDNVDTETVDESEQFDRLAPGIRVQLDAAFFQENILDMEGSSELSTQANFNNFLRGINFTLQSAGGDALMMLFDLADANITISYSYTTEGETSNRDFVLNFLNEQISQTTGQVVAIDGNAVNTFINEEYTPEVRDAIASNDNAERIFLKGGAGSFAEINLFDDANGREIIDQIRANNWIINEANLVFYVEETAGVILPPRLYLYSLESNLPLIGFGDVASTTSSFDSYPFYDGLLDGDGSEGSERKYTIRITDYINDLILRDADNVSLGLTITPDIRIFNISSAMLDDGTEVDIPVAPTISPLGTVLFGSNVSEANAGQKLQLELFYTQTN